MINQGTIIFNKKESDFIGKWEGNFLNITAKRLRAMFEVIERKFNCKVNCRIARNSFIIRSIERKINAVCIQGYLGLQNVKSVCRYNSTNIYQLQKEYRKYFNRSSKKRKVVKYMNLNKEQILDQIRAIR